MIGSVRCMHPRRVIEPKATPSARGTGRRAAASGAQLTRDKHCIARRCRGRPEAAGLALTSGWNVACLFFFGSLRRTCDFRRHSHVPDAG
jgi:hypothetical protein